MIYHCAYSNPWKVKWVNVLILTMLFLKNEKKLKGEPRVYYILRKYKNKLSYYIMTDISENFTSVQLMDSLVNVNHYISIVRYWIFESNYKKALVLNRESLGMICAPYVGE